MQIEPLENIRPWYASVDRRIALAFILDQDKASHYRSVFEHDIARDFILLVLFAVTLVLIACSSGQRRVCVFPNWLWQVVDTPDSASRCEDG